MFRSLLESSRQLVKIGFRLHDWSQLEILRLRDDLCHFGPWRSELLKVLADLVSQTRFNFVDVVAVAS